MKRHQRPMIKSAPAKPPAPAAPPILIETEVLHYSPTYKVPVDSIRTLEGLGKAADQVRAEFVTAMYTELMKKRPPLTRAEAQPPVDGKLPIAPAKP